MENSQKLRCGDTIEMPKSVHAAPHLWILVTDPKSDTGEVVIVNVTSLKPESDRTVIVSPREHPYIRHESVVFFQDARICSSFDIEKLLSLSSICCKCDPCPQELLKRIQQG